MAASNDTLIPHEELAPHSTVPDIEIPTAGLPEAPSVSDVDLRASAAALVSQWRLLPKDTAARGLTLRLKSLATRLKERLAACKSIATKELTPQLEFLESTRMFEAALLAADSASDTFASLPLIQLAQSEQDGSDIPRVMNLAECYLAAVNGIWSAESLAIFAEEAQKLDPLKLQEVRVLPQALKVAQLEYLLDRADEAFAAGPLPPIEQPPPPEPVRVAHSPRIHPRLRRHPPPRPRRRLLKDGR